MLEEEEKQEEKVAVSLNLHVGVFFLPEINLIQINDLCHERGQKKRSFGRSGMIANFQDYHDLWCDTGGDLKGCPTYWWLGQLQAGLLYELLQSIFVLQSKILQLYPAFFRFSL